jgi:hypothetical protein
VRPAAARPPVPLRASSVLTRTNEILSIDPRFCGPADRANGGYLAGLLARHVEGPLQLTLRRPVPLGRPLHVQHDPAGSVLRVLYGGEVLAEATAAPLELDVPAAPGLEAAAQASQRYIGFHNHPFPNCFVCGPKRTVGDGLRIFAGRVEGQPLVAAPWTPHAAFADERDRIHAEVVWAALDCPGCFAALLDRPLVPSVLGRFTAQVARQPRADEPIVAIGWPIEHDGRKHRVGTALMGRDGDMIGKAVATWIDVAHGDAGA